MSKFTQADRKLLKSMGISVADSALAGDRLALAERIAKHKAPTQKDGTVQQLEELGIPVTRANYLALAFAGKPPKEPLDGEIEEMLPDGIRNEDDDIGNSPTAGMSDEPSNSTPAGFPICPRCNRSTRAMGRLICQPCMSGTRLPLTSEDRRWLQGLRIAR